MGDGAGTFPVIEPAAVLSRVDPVIPMNLRDLPMESSFQALFTVHEDGRADVEMTESTGSGALDSVALAAARHWKFHAATSDGEPVASYLRLQVKFDVD